jgi:glycosyltransferase involved in cell wall biosynthesis
VAVLLLRAMLINVVLVVSTLHLLRLGTYNADAPFLYSRLCLSVGWVMTYAGVSVWRILAGRLGEALVRRGIGVRRVLVLESESAVARLADAITTQPWIGDRVVGDLRLAADAGAMERLADAMGRTRARVVWIAGETSSPAWIIHLMRTCAGTDIRWAMPRHQFDELIMAVKTPEPGTVPASDALLADMMEHVDRRVDPLEKPRIAILGSRGIPATYGGVERSVEELSTRLAKQGFRVAVYCRPHYTAQRRAYHGVELRHLPSIRTKHLEAITHTLFSTLHVLFQEDDIVHYQALGPSLLAWLPRVFGRRVVVTVQGLDWQRQKWGRVARAVLRAGEWASARFPNRTVVVSRALETHYRDHYHGYPVYAPNGVNDPVRRPADAIRAWGLQPGSFILSVGRLVPEKSLELLIRAFGRVPTDKRLVIAGGESHSQDYVDGLHAMATDPRVVFTGYVYGTVFEELLSNAYLFVTASEVEGLPLALLEAMSYGLCVLASDIPPHLEALDGLGHVFRRGDEGDLAARIQALADDPAGVTAMGGQLQARVRDRYAWEPVAATMAHVYEDLAGRSGR